MEQKIQLPEILDLAREIHALAEAIRQLEKLVLPRRLWYSRLELAQLKGMPVSAFYNKPWLLPPGGPQKQGGTDRWSYKQVWESGWIWKSDNELNPRGGDDDGKQADSRSAGEATPAALRRLRRVRQGVLRGQRR